jgi:hypothetical protein
MRRDPPFEAVHPAYLAALDGSGVLISGVADTCYALQSVTVASLGASGTAVFDLNGVPKTLAVPANGTAECFLGGLELPPSGDLALVTSTPMDVSALYVIVDHTPGVTKEAARAATYQASLASPKAIRAPNRFGGQVEG